MKILCFSTFLAVSVCSSLILPPVHAFSVGRTRATRTASSRLQTAKSNALPPPTTPAAAAIKSGSINHKRSNNRRSKGPGPSEKPENVPSLSEIMIGATEDDFRGDIVDQRTVPRRGYMGDRRGAKNNNNTRRRPRPRNVATNEPYRAPYQVSLKTQAMLKATAESSRIPTHERAQAVLTALLKTPPEQINEANVVCALTLSAKCMTTASSELRQPLLDVLDILHLLTNRLKARQLCNAVYAIAKHYNRDHSILPAPPAATALSSEEMVGVAEAWILQDEEDDSAERRLEQTIETIAVRLTETLVEEDTSTRRKPNVGEVSMACWAYGVLRQRVRPPGWEVPPQLSRLPKRKPAAKASVQLVTFEQWAVSSPDDKNQELVTTQEPVGRMFDAVAEFLCEEQRLDTGNNETNMFVQDMAWSEIANVAWAFANHGHCRTEASERLMVTLAGEGVARLARTPSTFLPRDVSQLVWSIGTLQSDNFRLGDGLVSLIDAIGAYYMDDDVEQQQQPFQRWSNADLVQLSIALAHGRIDDIPLLRALFREARLRLWTDSASRGSFYEWEVSVLLWVQARLYLKGEQGQEFQDFARESPKWLMRKAQGAPSLEDIGIGAQEQANLAWSLTVLEEYDSPDTLALLKAIFKEAAATGNKSEYIQLEHAHQLWQALFLTEYECPEAVKHVPAWFRDFLKEKWSVEKARQKISSARHRSLSRTLDLMGVSHYNEHDEDIDVAIVLKENAAWTGQAKKDDHTDAQFKVALEFDGPLHFTREAYDDAGTKIDPRALGHTALKYRLLKRQGWAVVRVPYYEFDKIPYWASMERQRYLQRLLKTHANIRFSEVDISEYKAIAPNRLSRFD